jgi:hypothetical protein
MRRLSRPRGSGGVGSNGRRLKGINRRRSPGKPQGKNPGFQCPAGKIPIKSSAVV